MSHHAWNQPHLTSTHPRAASARRRPDRAPRSQQRQRRARAARAYFGAVQRRAAEDPAEDARAVHEAARAGVEGAGGRLPYLDRIQAAFGRHDVTGVRAHTGAAAARAATAIGAEAYATGDDVAFRGSPSLHTAAHEAAHVVQQRIGVQLKEGVGEEGDRYERHADAVADAVVQGRSAEAALDAFVG